MNPSEIPAHEMDNLHFTCEDAEEAAAEGDVGEGYEMLSGGLYRAEQLQAEGWPWGEALVEHWQAVAKEYNRKYNRRQGSRTALPPLPEATGPATEERD